MIKLDMNDAAARFTVEWMNSDFLTATSEGNF